MKLTHFIIAFFCFFTTHNYAQESAITIISKQNKFVLMIDNLLQNNIPTDSLHLNKITTGSYSFKIIDIDSLYSIEKTIYLNSDEHIEYHYSLEHTLADLRLIGQYTELINDSLFVQYKANHIYSPSILLKYVTDTSKAEQLIYNTNYSGNKGCSNPDLINIKGIIKKINAEPFSKSKQKIILKALNEKCLMVDDLFQILETLDFEDHRLSLISKLSQNIYDLDNFNQLEKLFEIQQNIISFLELKNSL